MYKRQTDRDSDRDEDRLLQEVLEIMTAFLFLPKNPGFTSDFPQSKEQGNTKSWGKYSLD